MKTLLPLLIFFFSPFLSFPIEIKAVGNNGGEVDNKSIYVVYMGAVNSEVNNYIQLLTSVLDRKDAVSESLVHRYQNGFSGFAARLSKAEADRLATMPGVISVFEDPVYQLHTTRSWDFLQYQTEVIIDSQQPNANDTNNPTSSHGTDTIIGFLDTGIWPESESFSDKDMGPIPSRWKGVCMEGDNFSTSNCNKKLIGARYYNDTSSSGIVVHEQSPRDFLGHGTHTASTAAGAPVPHASYYDLATGTAKGGSPGSRIAVYRVCTNSGCRGSAILAAFDDAIADGVDVLSISLGASFFKPDFSTDPIAIGAFHAVDKNITVVCSAGNDGPTPKTVVNAAPWILTIAATTIDRFFESDIIMGSSSMLPIIVQGEGIHFSNLEAPPKYTLITGESAKSSSSTNNNDARNCNPTSLDPQKIKGKIVVCEHSDESYTKREKMDEVRNAGGVGLILIDDADIAVPSPTGDFPLTVVSSKDAARILSYINSTKNPLATILPTTSVTKHTPAPTVAYFSSRGPSVQTANLLKPDVAAPGVNILAAWIESNDTSEVPKGKKQSHFNLLSGTSMSCPHVSGVAASVKSINPGWSPSAIRSAIMTTATELNTEKAPLTTNSGSPATPYDYGTGEVNPSAALQPGLIYETTTNDYLLFLCNYGYKVSTIKLISNIPKGFECPDGTSRDLISNLNYPSIAISKFNGKESKKVSRTVTNVGSADDTVYRVTITSPEGLNVKVIPNKLEFTKSNKKLTYEVIFSSSSEVKGDLFGSITWSDGKYKVRTPFVVTSNDESEALVD